MTATTKNRRDAVRNHAAEVRQWVSELQADLDAIMQDKRYSDEYRRELVAETKSRHAAQIERGARLAWQAAQREVAGLNKEIETTLREPAGMDYGKLNFLVQEYASQLSSASEGFLGQGGVLNRVAELYDQAIGSGDAVRIRAFKVAAGPVIEQARRAAPATSTQAFEALDLARQLAHDPQAEAVAELKRERNDLVNRDVPALRSAILHAEEAATDFKHGVFSGLSPWMASVLNEDHASAGLVVPKYHEDAPRVLSGESLFAPTDD